MSAFDLERSIDRAEKRLAAGAAGKRRADAGKLRLAPPVLARLRALVLGQERPRTAEIRRQLERRLRPKGLPVPARATIHGALARIEGHTYRIDRLPAHVRDTLYNLDPQGEVPGPQLAFYCFNHGPLPAVCFAAGLPWLDLHQASTLGGWRPRSRGLLDAVLAARGIR